MKAVGGYFGLELNKGKEFYSDSIKLNLGRSCLKYVLMAKNIKKLYMPYYICDSLINAVKEVGTKIELYNINEMLSPVSKIETTNNDEAILHVNYFGINPLANKQTEIEEKNYIVDNSQAFFYAPEKNADTYYSARKFFGVADGAYLYSNTMLDNVFQQDHSHKRMEYLLKRIDEGAAEAYSLFTENENNLSGEPIKYMSKITQSILKSIDYEKVRMIRERNFFFLHSKLNNINQIKIDEANVVGPMVYPLLITKKNMKEYLIEKKFYVATYWKEVLGRVNESSFESQLVNYLLPLPIDQRYNLQDMSHMLNIISEQIL